MLALRAWRFSAAQLLLGAMLAFAPLPCRAFDFTLNSFKVEEDGFTHEESYFTRDARTNIGIRIPPQWTAAGAPAALSLTSPSAAGSSLRLEPSALTPAVTFLDAGLADYRKIVLAEVPAGSTEVRLTDEKANPLPIFHWTDHEFTVEFSLYGQRYVRSVVFINLDPKQQMRLTIVGLKADFARVHEAGYTLLQSWQEMPVASAQRAP